MADRPGNETPQPVKAETGIAAAVCAGKTFEHHVRVEMVNYGGDWRCPLCDTTGTLKEVNDRLWPLVLTAEGIRERMNLVPVILLPSESPPGLIGQFWGYDLYRVQGIDSPMAAMRGIGGG